MRTIRLLHRIAVDQIADTFNLRGRPARERHEEAHARACQRATRLAARGEPRVLKSRPNAIGQAVTRGEAQR
jgi:hypothetical protein